MRLAACTILIGVTALTIAGAQAQTANSSPTAPAPGGLPGTPAPMTRIAPSGGKIGPQGGKVGAQGGKVGAQGGKVGAGALTGQAPAHKPTAAEIRAQKQLDRDMNICKGC